MKNLYTNLYAAFLLSIGSTMYADSNTPYNLYFVNNSTSDGITVTITARNTHDSKNKTQSITLSKGGSQTVSLNKDLRGLKVSGWKASENPSNLAYISIGDNSNGTQKFRRGATININGAPNVVVIPTGGAGIPYTQQNN